MDFSIVSKLNTSKMIIIPLFEEQKIKNFKINFPKQIKKDFTGKDKQIISFYDKELVVLVGLGDIKKFDIEKLDSIIKFLVSYFKKLDKKEMIFCLNGKERGIEFMKDQMKLVQEHLYSFSISDKKEESKKKYEINFYAEMKYHKELSNFIKMLDSIKLVKDLGEEPANILTPTEFVKRAKVRGKQTGFTVKVIEEKQLKKMGMNSLLSVSEGSQYPGYLVELHLNGRKKTAKNKKSIRNNKNSNENLNKNGKKMKTKKNKKSKIRSENKNNNNLEGGGKPIIIVGKGVTFDTGGNSLKGSNSMIDMKTDMLGAATVLAIMDYLSKIGCKKNVIGLMPIVENMPGRYATRPGDIVKSYSGKTIEIMDTDAEGRLILADALTYAQEFNPTKIVDLATLTGSQERLSCGLFTSILGNDTKFNEKLIDIGDKTNEKLVELPVYRRFIDDTKSDIADVKNSDFKCKTGVIYGAAFLWNFVNEDKVKWAHLDIAGPSRKEGNITGVCVRLLSDYILEGK